MAHTTEMFQKPVVPRIKRMHMIDVGHIEGEHAARFECRRCGHLTGWVLCSRGDTWRGLPCPNCNAVNSGAGQ